MASRLFTKAPTGLTLEGLQHLMADAAKKVNDERDTLGTVRFARVYAGPVLVDPRNGSKSFLVSYSETDPDAPEMIDTVLNGTAEQQECDRKWFNTRDPYCA
jgi:hypothetical protein